MILLDTHIFIWWIDDSPRLSQRHRQIVRERQDDGLAISMCDPKGASKSESLRKTPV
jgi:PIN domain nuclease of toxin-antitoxin system